MSARFVVHELTGWTVGGGGVRPVTDVYVCDTAYGYRVVRWLKPARWSPVDARRLEALAIADELNEWAASA